MFPHATGRWAKKIKGELHYFGYWARREGGKLVPVPGDGWEEAKKEYDRVIDDLVAGRKPRAKDENPGGLAVWELCDRFLVAKQAKVDAGELTQRMFGEYKVMTDLCVKHFGRTRLVEDLRADDFAALRAAMVKKGKAGDGWGPHRVTNGVTRVKSIFKFGFEAGLLDRPPRYGPEFAPPSRSVMRRHRAKSPAKMFEADELRAMIDGKAVEREGEEPEQVKPDPAMKAMILLGVNCGFGNDDVAGLKFEGLKLETGWLDYPRAKTGIQRRCPLWPETVAAIEAAIKVRPKPANLEDCGLVFLTYRGTRWVRVSQEKDNRSDYVSQAFNKYLKRLGLSKEGFGFYTLRHVFRTVADGARDIPAVRAIMGHVDASIDAAYRERIEDARLRAVVDHVRAWLWPSTQVKAPESPKNS
jgi:integrase